MCSVTEDISVMDTATLAALESSGVTLLKMPIVSSDATCYFSSSLQIGGIIGTCNTATGVDCCGGTWMLNTVQVKCTGVPIAGAGTGALQRPSWGWIGLMGGGLVFSVYIALGVLINSVILQRRSCSPRTGAARGVHLPHGSGRLFTVTNYRDRARDCSLLIFQLLSVGSSAQCVASTATKEMRR